MERPFAFGPKARLSDRKDYQRVFSQGRRIVGRNMILWYRKAADASTPRLGLSVSAKVGPAVHRNRLKRLSREAFRLNRALLAPGSDLVIYPRPGCSWKKLSDAQSDFLSLCSKAGLITPPNA